MENSDEQKDCECVDQSTTETFFDNITTRTTIYCIMLFDSHLSFFFNGLHFSSQIYIKGSLHEQHSPNIVYQLDQEHHKCASSTIVLFC
jgi:hypothetical protein